jgi:uncharacterized YigZ family protein
MKFVKEEFSSILEIKKSKFITHICPYPKFNKMMERLKSEHPKGRHFVYAYRYLNEFDQIVENSSDDGEPKGTSGKPSLNVLSGSEIINTGVIIVRYFGGIRLGTGGLVKAYSDAVNQVLNESELFEYVKMEKKSLQIDYSDLSKIEYLINQEEISIIDKEFENSVKLTLESSKNCFKNLAGKLPIDIKLKDI